MVFTPQKKARSRSPHQFDHFLNQLQAALQAQSSTSQTSPGQTSSAFQGQSLAPSSCSVTPSCLSVALPLEDLDPLQALAKMGGFQIPHFYWEQPSQGLAIAAAQVAIQATFQGPQRFSQAQAFVSQQQRRICLAGDRQLPGAQPRFFCSFTFFDQTAAESPFPPATLLLPRWQVVRQGEANRHLHQRLPKDRARSSFVANFRLRRGQLDLQAVRETWELYTQLKTLAQRGSLTEERYVLAQTASGDGNQFLGKHASGNGTSDDERAPSSATRLGGEFDSEAFESSVAAVLEQLDGEPGSLHKAVMAQVLKVTAETPLNPHTALDKLRLRHPDCYSFSVGNGEGAVFLGASPERLIQVQERRLYTEALAGSAPRGITPATDIQLAQSLRNSPKELHEHRLVADFIEQQLVELGLNPQSAAEPQILQLTGIQHLQTAIHCNLLPGIHPFEILAQLHPTPAVGGVPQRAACEQIQQLEGFERSLYAAPLGWIDGEGNCEFCVGIRSALLQGNQAQLFAGAGIVSGSEPAQERAEVELKLRALLLALTDPSSEG